MIERFRRFCLAVWPPVLFGLVVSNFALSCSAYRSASPREYHYYREITNNVPVVAGYSPASTNLVATGSSESPGNPVPVPPTEISLPYTYMVVGGAPCIRYYGRYYYEGDVMSRGRIFRIFPDRVFLQTGDIICNSSVPVDRPSPSSRRPPSPPKVKPPDFKRMFK